MSWPSKNPDDYVGRRPIFVPRETPEQTPLAELDPKDWRVGTVRNRSIGVWWPPSVALAYVGSLIAGADVLHNGDLAVLAFPTFWLSQYIGHRFLAARMVGPAWPPSLRFAPATGAPWLLTVAAIIVTVLVGAALLAAATTNEQTQTLGLLAILLAAPVPAWLLERRALKRSG